MSDDHPDEITLGLIASIASVSKAVARRPLRSPKVVEALLKLRENAELAVLLQRGVSPPVPSPCSPLEPPLTPTPAPPLPKAVDTQVLRCSPRAKDPLLLATENSTSPDVQEVVDFWNSFFSLPRINSLGKRTAKVVKALKNEYWKENYQDGIRKAVKTPFCMGKNRRRWVVDIEWFSDPTNLDKLLSGKYDHTSSTSEPPDYAREEI